MHLLTIYSDRHLLHAPKHEFIWGKMVPFREAPTRAENILEAVKKSGLGEILPPEDYGMGPIESVHDKDYLDHLKTAFVEWIHGGGNPEGVFPDTYRVRVPPTKSQSAIWRKGPAAFGYYQFDTSAVIVEKTWNAAYEAVQVALTGASRLIREGHARVFALCRPPGHHSDSDLAGGYCFLNNAGIAAQYLINDLKVGRVAILDIDYHHGNGTQQLFYKKSNPMYISIHGQDDYPFYWGSGEETGDGEGFGFNINIPLPAGTKDETYIEALQRAINDHIHPYNPNVLVVSLGVDTFEKDPIGAFSLSRDAFRRIGTLLKEQFASTPTLFVMEGGYAIDDIGDLVVSVLTGE